MEAWLMVKTSVIAFFLLGIGFSHSSHAADIRFYKINKHKQTDRLWVSKKKSTQTGCNNFRGAPRIFIIAQIGYQSCSVYSEKNCLSEGFGWKPSSQQTLESSDADSRGVKLRSWNCQ